MSIEFKSDLEKFNKKLEKNVESLNGEVSFSVIFNNEFMTKYTQFESFDELLKAGKFIVNSQEDFEAIPDDVFDEHIKKFTEFDSWQEMLSSAGTAYAASKLKF